MYSLASFSISDMTECASELRKLGAGASSAQEVAQRIASYLYRQLGNDQTGRQDCALVRCFLTRPYRELDPQSQDCARRALACGPGSLDMKCLTLFGTAGEKPEWNERHRSRRYRSIPLADKQVLSQFPMVLQLLQQLGVDFISKTQHESDRPVEWLDQPLNVFHVAEAKGSSFLPAQEEFVIPFGIESVLAVGGVLPSKELFTVILFSKQKISRETAELFKPLALSVELALLPFDDGRLKRSAMAVTDMQKLVHDLQVHQIELDMQNDELRRTQVEIETARDRYVDLYDFSSTAHLMMDRHGTIVEANVRAGTLLGIDRQKLIGQPLARFFVSEDQDTFRQHCQDVLKTGTRQTRDLHLRSKAGAISWVQLESLAFHDESGSLTHWRMALLDITYRKWGEQAKNLLIEDLSRSQQYFSALFNWIPSAVGISTVAEGRLCDVNEGFSRLTGYAREELIGRTDLELGLWADPSERATVLRELQEQGSLHNREGLLRTKPGEIRFLMVSVDLIQLGSTPCLIYLGHDITERKREEEALWLAKFMMDRAADAVYWIDPQAKIMDANEAASLMLGYSKDELCAMTVHDLNPDFQADMWPGFWAETRRSGTKVIETFHKAKNGRLIAIEVSVNYLLYEGKEYHCAFARDITERKRAEEELRGSEARLRAILDNSPGLVFLKDAEGRYLDINRQFENAFHVTREQVVGKTDEAIFAPDQAAAFRANDLKVLQAGILLEFEEVAMHDDGLHTSIVSKFPLSNGNGKLYALCGITTDITERKRIEEALRKSEDRYRSIFENAVEGIFQTTLDGKYVTVNPALAHMYGYDSPEDMIAAITDIASQLYVDPGRRNEFIRLMQEQEKVNNFEALVYRKDGSFIWISENVRAMRDQAGVLVGYEGRAEDITGRKRGEERLHATLEEVRMLSGRLATAQEEERTRIARELHDELGVGLTCLKIDLSRLATIVGDDIGDAARAKLDDKVHSMVEQVDGTIASVQRLVTQLRPALLDDLGLVAAIEWQCQDFQKRTGIPCTCVTSAADIAMESERARALFRICQEALTNTARHAQATAVTVKLESRNDSLQLVVADNGVGIPDTKASDRRSLGLLGMRERAALFGGEITIQSHPEKGTTVTTCLPQCPA